MPSVVGLTDKQQRSCCGPRTVVYVREQPLEICKERPRCHLHWVTDKARSLYHGSTPLLLAWRARGAASLHDDVFAGVFFLVVFEPGVVWRSICTIRSCLNCMESRLEGRAGKIMTLREGWPQVCGTRGNWTGKTATGFCPAS